MTQPLEQIIDQANRRHAAARNRQFGMRSSDSQMLEHLARVAQVVVDDHKAKKNIDPAMLELSAFLRVVNRRSR